MVRESSARHWFLCTALAGIGIPYKWGGDNPSGFDCSGFVIECLRSAGLIDDRLDFTADGLLVRFSDAEIAEPRRGALMFVANEQGQACHVAICLDEHFQIAASGGNHDTLTVADAWRDRAWVKIRPIPANHLRLKFIDPFLTIKE
jgi:cell wall-associated NlpC family hydrolase